MVHEQRKDHACPQCDAAFGQSSNLAKLVRGVHGIVNGGSGGKQRAPPVTSAGQKRKRPAAKDGQSAAAAAGSPVAMAASSQAGPPGADHHDSDTDSVDGPGNVTKKMAQV